ncbi:histidine phosphatase family protein [Marinomonas epiphytica]
MKLLPKPFVFVRHAQSTLNAASIIAGFTDSPLSDEGIEQAKRASSKLNQQSWSIVATSTLVRTHQTAQYAVPSHSITQFEGLKERFWGDLEGSNMEQTLRYEDTPPGGESWQAFEERVINTLNDILTHYDWPLIVAHSGVYRVLNHLINGTAYCPRVENVSPITFLPSENQQDWIITPFEGKTV